MAMIPSSPVAFGVPMDEKFVLETAEFVAMREGFEREAAERDAVFKQARELGHRITVAKHAITTGAGADRTGAMLDEVKASLAALLAQKEGARTNGETHNGALNGAIEKCATAQMLAHFLHTGALLGFEALQAPCRTSRDAYLCAVMEFVGDLGSYSLGRATQRDIRSIVCCRNMVDEINAHLMTFDFRNGPLRRNYDRIKYTLKRIEDLLYELSLTSAGEEAANKVLLAMPRLATAGTKRKHSRTTAAPKEEASAAAAAESSDSSSSGRGKALTEVNAGDFARLRGEMEAYDKTRDDIIKATRDILKGGKQAIYCSHRGDGAKCAALLAESEAGARALLPHIEAHPSLRGGSYANALEEWAEGKLFEHFLKWNAGFSDDDDAAAGAAGAGGGGGAAAADAGAAGEGGGGTSGLTACQPLSTLDLLNAEEYVGALVDLTGEIGRFAVAKATARRTAAVARCHAVMDAICSQLLLVPLPGKMAKKVSALSTNRRKVETIIYDLSLTQGGKATANSAGADTPMPDGGDDEE